MPFLEKDIHKPVATFTCRRCGNKFKGNTTEHSRQLLNDHYRRKHEGVPSDVVT